MCTFNSGFTSTTCDFDRNCTSTQRTGPCVGTCGVGTKNTVDVVQWNSSGSGTCSSSVCVDSLANCLVGGKATSQACNTGVTCNPAIGQSCFYSHEANYTACQGSAVCASNKTCQTQSDADALCYSAPQGCVVRANCTGSQVVQGTNCCESWEDGYVCEPLCDSLPTIYDTTKFKRSWNTATNQCQTDAQFA